ncbi:MAG: hypothetical protein MK110_17335 [Fuerstiella sp.]|nr:hypothetical protein [Fuerstiella sp.]
MIPSKIQEPIPEISIRKALPRWQVIQELRSGLRRFEHGVRARSDHAAVVSTGIPALDAILPDHGLRCGTLCEWIGAQPGSGVATLAMSVAGQAQKTGPLVIVDAQRTFYPAALPSTGVSLTESILVRPKSKHDELFTIEQALRCSGVGVVLGFIDRLRNQQFRRLQLAAESGTAIGMLIRPSFALKQTGWADVRLLALPQPSPSESFCRFVELRCLYAKGGTSDRSVDLEVNDETNHVRVAAKFSHSTCVLPTAGVEISSVRNIRGVG